VLQLSGAYVLYKDKRAEEGEEGGNRPSQIGREKGQHKGTSRGTGSLTAGGGADTESKMARRGCGAEAECGMRGGLRLLRSEQAPAGGFVGRQPITSAAEIETYSFTNYSF